MKLKECCTLFTDGNWIESKDQSESGIRLIQTGNVGNGIFLEKEARAKYIDEKTFEILGCTEVYPGDILVSRLPDPVGRACIVPEKKERMVTAVDCSILRVNDNVVNKRYLLHYLKSQKYFNQIIGKLAGTTRTRISRKNLEQIVIDIPERVKQEKIAKVLDNIENLIKIEQKQLEAYDILIKSRFVEMFGSCKDMRTMEDLCLIITDGTHQPPRFQEKGIPFIFVSNLSENKVTYNSEKFISDETYNELIKRTPIEKGDILLSTVGSYGHPAVVIEETKFLFQRHIAYLKPKHDLINSFYLHSVLLSPDAQRQIEEKVRGIAQKTLNLSGIREIIVPVPSMEQQIVFEHFVRQVDKSKAEEQRKLEKMQILFDSLMQQYFG